MNETVEKTKEVEINLPIVIVGFHFAGQMPYRGRQQVITIAEVPEPREYFDGNPEVPIILTAFDVDQVEIIE